MANVDTSLTFRPSMSFLKEAKVQISGVSKQTGPETKIENLGRN